MGRQIQIMQSAQDELELWDALTQKFDVGCIPWQMHEPPATPSLLDECGADSLILFARSGWEELRRFLVLGADGSYSLRPRVGIIEWNRTVQLKQQYLMGARLYFEKADVPWSASSETIFSWAFRWIKKNYIQVIGGRFPILVGPALHASYSSGKCELIWPKGTPLVPRA